MSRIIIIGNGFDIAHGLKTSYSDLMSHIKSVTDPYNAKKSHYEDGCGGVHHIFRQKKNPYITFKSNNSKRDYDFSHCSKNKSLYFQSLFKSHNKYEKWADLEAHYFNLIIKNVSLIDNIDLINQEFEYLKLLLEDYLAEQIEKNVADYDFSRSDFFTTSNISSDKILGIINFNYTSKLVSSYLKSIEKTQLHNDFCVINIHGKLNDISNPIIFGYGDDNSEKYRNIQDELENKLLVNFKTFQYLRNKNYRTILGMLEVEDNLKVEIIGHSCALTDKALLKTIFEHTNVIDIEYRYHSDEKHYFKNLYNISRIFTDIPLMRKKVLPLDSTRIIESQQIELIS